MHIFRLAGGWLRSKGENMGKVVKEKKFRVHAKAPGGVAATPAAALPNTNEAPAEKLSVASRGQRKRQVKKDRYLKKMGMVSALKLHKDSGKNAGLQGFSDILDVVGELPDKQGTSGKTLSHAPKMVNSKGRRQILAQEVAQLSAVHSHPQFKQNPFETLMQHLNNSVPPPPTEATQFANKKNKSRNRKKK